MSMRNSFEGPKGTEARADEAIINRRVAEAYPKKAELLKSQSIQLEDFTELYGQENILKDKAVVERLKKNFGTGLSSQELAQEQETKRAAEIFEAIMLEQSELSNWFGENASTIKTSEFDDIVNGVDMVIEVDEPGSSPGHVALAVDVSFGTIGIERKIARAKTEIDQNNSGNVKYFFSEKTGFKGQLTRVPRIVLGVEKARVAELIGLDMNKRLKDLAQHPIQRVIAAETCTQLEIFSKYAQSKGNMAAANTYGRAFQFMQRTLSNQRRMPIGDLGNDRVFERIMWQIERVK